VWEKKYVKEGYLKFLLIMRIENDKELFVQIENVLTKKIIHKNLNTGLGKDGQDYDRGFLEERNGRLIFRERK